MRLAITMLLLLLAPGMAIGQAGPEPKDPNKVSNDDPGRPLQMPPASTETREALDDFDRFQRRGAWERALKSLYTIPDDQARRFVDGEKGFIIPVERRRRAILAALPAAGQAACRLFYDSDAKKLLDEADGPNELKNLERVYSAYFITTVGDNAADRLGDLYFEQGRFDRAADCWLAVLRDRPDTDLAPAMLAVKAALALDRAGRRSELDQLRVEIADRYRDDPVTIAGRSGSAAEVLGKLLGEVGSESASAEAAQPMAPGPDVAREVAPAWRLRIADSIEAGMAPIELNQWRSSMLSVAVPAVAVDGGKLYVNYLSHVLALDLDGGKLLWRSGSFHNIELLAMQPVGQMLDPARFAIVASGENVWDLSRDVKDQNMMAPFRLTCHRADNGEVIWKSSDSADYAEFELVGPPILADGKLFAAGKSGNNRQMMMQGGQRQPQQFALAIRPHDGKILWKTEIGTFRQGERYYWYYMKDDAPQPRLLYRSGAVFVDTHVGILGRLDGETGSLDWGYGYKTAPFQSWMYYYYRRPEPTIGSSPPLSIGETMLVKGMQSDRLAAIDSDRMKVLWDRPIAKSSRLLGVVGDALILGGAELAAVDLKTRSMLWSASLPSGSLDSRVLVRPDGIWQLTPRGIFEVDPASGEVRRIFRGQDLGSAGGDLVLTDRWLLAISNRSITAYPRRGGGAEAPATVRVDPATTKEKASP